MRSARFQDLDNPQELQQTLFAPPGVSTDNSPFPLIRRKKDELKAIVDNASLEGIGLDLEFNPKTNKPSIIGVANEHECGASLWDADFCKYVVSTAKSRG